MTESRIIIVTGARHWTDRVTVWRALEAADPHLVVQGGCPRGADKIAWYWARHKRIPCETFHAEWSLGTFAGPARNRRMLRAHPSARVLAFPLGGPGTADCILAARELGMSVTIFEPRATSPSERRAARSNAR